MRNFGDRLREAAKNAGHLTDADAARAACVEVRAYGNYVKGRIPKDLQTLIRICRTFGTTPNHLLGFDVPDYQQEAAAIAERLMAEDRELWFRLGRRTASKEQPDSPRGRRRRAA
jgi:transcriptional regulator with XRE-family HTH domain